MDGQQSVKSKSSHYLLNVVELSAAYRDRLLHGIERRVERQEIVLADTAAEEALAPLLVELRVKQWEVFIKPFATSEVVTEYLSRYVRQVALSNYRLESIDQGQVRFRYYDNRKRTEVGEKGKEKVLIVTGEEFIRRFLLHIARPQSAKPQGVGWQNSIWQNYTDVDLVVVEGDVINAYPIRSSRMQKDLL
ncbi:MAG: hypothetical protein BroJett011_04820 [Chloroflexota bacterium]|nr:MAG: hypothetical protein BroJett011_04820 [Chloroflexota bacterium]